LPLMEWLYPSSLARMEYVDTASFPEEMKLLDPHNLLKN